jgi:MFS family permease
MPDGGRPENQTRTVQHHRFQLPGALALRYRDFRLFWSGHATEVAGQQMLWIAQGWLLYELSGSAVVLGAAGLARAIPSTLLSFIGGALADKLDQRRLLIGVQFVQMTLLLCLGLLTATGNVAVWHLIAVLSASAAAQSFENPARQAIFPRLVPREALMDAVALNSVVHPGTRLAGPLFGGLLMTQARLATGDPLAGPAVLFFLTASGYVVNAAFLYLIRPGPVQGRRTRTSMFADMGAGLKFIFANPIFGALILMTYCTQFFGWSFQSLFPVFVKDIFHGGEFELGLMGSVLGAGSLIGATLAANLSTVRRRGLLIIGGFVTPAALIILWALAPSFAVALPLLFLIGSTQALFNVNAQATLQYLVPDEFRGRVMGVWGMTHTAVQPLGQLQAGVVAGLLSAPFAVAYGGVAMLVIAVLFIIPNRTVRELSIDTHRRDDPVSQTGQEPLAASRH